MPLTKKLTKDQEEVWDRLKNGLPPKLSDRWAYSASSVTPQNAKAGAIYFDTNTNKMMIYDGTNWKSALV